MISEALDFAVVTTDPELLNRLRQSLAREKFVPRGRAFADTSELLATMDDQLSSVVLLDLAICEPTGVAFSLFLEKLSGRALVVGLCEDDNEDRAIQAMHAGVEDYFTPRQNRRLAAVIRRWQRSRSLQTGAVLCETGLHRAHGALLQLARSRAFQGENLISDFREITEVAAAALSVARVSIWLYDRTGQRIRCIDLFEANERRHTDGAELLFHNHPAYFLALEEQRLIVAHDARRDPRTADYSPGYLEPLGITSMLDAAVRQDGHLVGLICLEHVGSVRRWTVEEEVFTCAFADLVRLALDCRDRAIERLETAAEDSRLRDLNEQNPDALVFFEMLSTKVFALESMNPSAEKLFGLSLNQAKGKLPQELLPRTIAEQVLRCLQRSIEALAPFSVEQCWELPNLRRWFHCQVVPFHYFGQQLTRVALSWREISERKAFERALCDREEMFRRLVESTSVIPWESDIEFARFSYIGPQAVKRFGYSEAEWLSPGFWLQCVHPDDRGRVSEGATALVHRTSEYQSDYRVLTKTGEIVWIQELVNVVIDRQGSLMLRGFFVDITARRMAEAEVRAVNAELEKRVTERTRQLQVANRELESFCYSVSHDLRAPLRAIDGFSRAVQEDYQEKLDTEGHDMLSRIRAAAKRMGELIDDLLRLSRVSRTEMKTSRVSLSEVAKAVVAELSRHSPNRVVEWSVEASLFVEADPALMRILLDNLLSNALKYTGPREVAKIEFGQDRNISPATFFVRDNGVGFDSSHASKLFQPFQRMHHADEFEGHGIGLATVQRIINRHGGQVWAEAAVGQGATFWFQL